MAKTNDKPSTSKEKAKKSSKRACAWQSSEKKLEALEHYRNGKTKSEIARFLNLPFSTISNWIKSRDKILEHVQNSPDCVVKKVTRFRHPLKVKTDKMLLTWIEECNQLQTPISQAMIQTKCVAIFNKLKAESTDEKDKKIEYGASRG